MTVLEFLDKIFRNMNVKNVLLIIHNLLEVWTIFLHTQREAGFFCMSNIQTVIYELTKSKECCREES